MSCVRWELLSFLYRHFLCIVFCDYTVQGEDEALIQGAIEETVVGIYVVKHGDATDTPEDFGIVLEGHIVMQDLDNVALTAAMLPGLKYVLNLNYTLN